jgi:LCP family protein required for cell wall assembly
MARDDKPYRRFRARQEKGDLEELRRLNRAEEPRQRHPRDQARPSSAPRREPSPTPAPGTTGPREQGSPWWSLRGHGVSGAIGRVVVILLVGVMIWAVAGFLAVRSAVADSHALINPRTYAALDSGPGMLSGPTNVLVIGKDALRGQTRSRSDTILLMRLDPDEGRIKYLSIPRDTLVSHPRRGEEKINAAFFFGGQVGAINAVRRHTGLPIHHIMVVNIQSFPRMIDGLGGVTVNNPAAVVDCPYPGGRTVSFPRGNIALDGERALEFSRVRACGTDFERALRQQAVVAAMKRKVVSLGGLPMAPWRGSKVVRAIGTEMSTTELIKFGWLQARLDQRPEDRILLSGTPTMIGGVAYVIPDPDANEDEVARFLS